MVPQSPAQEHNHARQRQDPANRRNLAERAGFEPARGVNPYAISSRAHSSTLAPLRKKAGFGAGRSGRYVWADNIIARPWGRAARSLLTARAIASYRVRHNKRCKVLVSQMSATVYYRLSADASLGYRRNGRSQSSPPAFSSNEIPFPISAGCYSAKLNLDAIALCLPLWLIHVGGGTILAPAKPERRAGGQTRQGFEGVANVDQRCFGDTPADTGGILQHGCRPVAIRVGFRREDVLVTPDTRAECDPDESTNAIPWSPKMSLTPETSLHGRCISCSRLRWGGSRAGRSQVRRHQCCGTRPWYRGVLPAIPATSSLPKGTVVGGCPRRPTGRR